MLTDMERPTHHVGRERVGLRPGAGFGGPAVAAGGGAAQRRGGGGAGGAVRSPRQRRLRGLGAALRRRCARNSRPNRLAQRCADRSLQVRLQDADHRRLGLGYRRYYGKIRLELS
jgi:hypothetical protein